MKLLAKIQPKHRPLFDGGVILLCSFLLILPIYFWGIPGGADMPQHYQFAQTFYDSLANGIIYPSWSAETNYGYGDVGIRFYPPLTYYVLSFFRLIAGNWFEGSCLAFIFFFFVSGVGVYLWARLFSNENSALIGALFYLIVPYHVNQLYQAAMFAEFTGAAIIPFCFLFTTKICRKGSFTDILLLGLTFGLLILAHLPTTIMASAVLSVYVLFSLRKQDFIKTILKLSAGVSISLLLSSFYWVRMLTELNWVKHNLPIFSSGEFSYRTNFAFPFFSQIFGVTLENSNPYLDNMILILLGVLISNLILHFRRSKEKQIRPMFNLLAMTLFPLFMVSPFSLFLWENISLLQKIQFPWRWLIFVSLGISMFVAVSFETVVEYYKTPRRYLSLLAAGLLFLCIPYNGMRIINQMFLTPKDFFIGMTERLKTAKSNDCWWTVWIPAIYSEEEKSFLSKLETLPNKAVLNNRKIDIEKWDSAEKIFIIDAGDAGQAEASLMYYPHWKVSVNGEETIVSPSQNGLVSFRVSDRKSQVRLYFQEPNHVLIAFYISGFAWIILFVLLIFSANKFQPKLLYKL